MYSRFFNRIRSYSDECYWFWCIEKRERCSMWRFCDTRSSCKNANVHRPSRCFGGCIFKTGFDKTKEWNKIFCKRVGFPWFSRKIFRNKLEEHAFEMSRDRLQRIEDGRITVNFRNPKDGYYKDMYLNDLVTSLLKILEDNGLLRDYEFVDSHPEHDGYTPYELRKGKDDMYLHGNNIRDEYNEIKKKEIT